jgi:hypothetical protein
MIRRNLPPRAARVVDAASGAAPGAPLATLHVARDRGHAEGWRRYVVAVDGHPVAHLRGGETLRIVVEPGAREVELRSGGLASHALHFRAEPGEDVYLRAGNRLRSHNPLRLLRARTVGSAGFLFVLPDQPARRAAAGADAASPALPRWSDVDGAASVMRGFSAPWAVAGGWALDLFLGRVTRVHAGVDVALFREHQWTLLADFPGWTFHRLADGVFSRYRVPGWILAPHELRAESPGTPPALALRVLFHDRRGGEWVFPGDESIRLSTQRLILTSDAGIPFLCPAVVLFLRAEDPSEADETDFDVVREALEPRQRAWLRHALKHAYSGHAWLRRL